MRAFARRVDFGSLIDFGCEIFGFLDALCFWFLGSWPSGLRCFFEVGFDFV